VDVDSLNRHLSQNRRCSRADIEATDKLSILAPDTNYSKRLKAGIAPDVTLDRSHVSYVDKLHHLEGNLVNVANVMGIQALNQLNTSLHPDPSSMTFVITLADDPNHDGGVEKHLKSLEKLIASQSVQVQIFQDDNFGESEENQEDEANIAITSSSSSCHESVSIAGGDMSLNEQTSPAAATAVEFDVGIDDDSLSEEEVTASQLNNNQLQPLPAEETEINNNRYQEAMENLPIVQEFHGGSPQLDSLAELYTMLDKRGVANSLFDQIAEWAWINGKTFGRTPPMKRTVVVEKVFRHVRGDNYRQFMLPKQKVLKLSTGRHVAVTYFPIEMMLKDLLCNTTLMKAEHLLISDVNNPLNDDNHPMMSFGEVDSGTWWKTAREHECKEDSDMLWPLIMFIDGMKVGNLSGKLKLEPISFTFSRFRRWVRNQDNAWRTWAYMEEVKEPIVSDEDEEISLTPKERLQEYHDILTFLLKDLKTIQIEGFPWTLDLGGQRKHNVILKMPLQFVIGDCEGHDKLLGRFKGHTMNIKGLCRDCDIPTQDSDDIDWVCNFIEEGTMQNLDNEELRDLSFHKIVNGFDGISVGGCPRGIWTLFNPELLHLFKSGHCEWISDGYVFTLSSKATKYTNKASAYLVIMNRGQSDRSFPFIGTYRDGLLKPAGTNLMGHEKHARVFFIYMLLCCSDYVSMLVTNPKRGSSYDLRFYKAFLQMLEHCLGFHEWSTKRNHSYDTIVGPHGSPESSRSQASVRRYLSLLKNSCPREEMGKNYKMTKFHQTLHLVSGVSRHGSLLNVDGSRPESMAKGNVKDPASHTQRVSSTLSYQTGKRYIESLTFREYKRMKAEEGHDPVDCFDFGGYINRDTEEAKILRHSLRVENEGVVEQPSTAVSTGTSFSLVLDIDQPETQFQVDVHWKGKGKPNLGKFDEHLLQQLGKRLFGAEDGGVVLDSEVQCCTSVTVMGHQYTAHPLFRNEHPWHDWVYIHWQGYDDPIPARIDMFIDLRNAEISNVRLDDEASNTSNNMNDPIPFHHMFLENKLYAVVWSAKSLEFSRNKETQNHLPLKLGYRVELEDFRRIVDVESFVKPCFGFLNTCGISRLPFDRTAVILNGRDSWADHFLS
jgi:hypothetical protein